jgi:hypothetical protein
MLDANPSPSQPAGSAPDPHSDTTSQEQKALLKALVVTVHHFFGGFARLFQSVSDPRHPAYITYPLPVVLASGALMFMLHLGARRQVKHWLRDNAPSEAKFKTMFGVEACPHGDSMNYTYKRLEVAQVQAVVTGMTESLIRSKVLYPYRLRGRYFLVSIDGTGILTFPERHCPHCLTCTHHGQTVYYHPVLEAKLVTSAGLVCSLMTEFIENPGEFPTKQDCELKAFYRLAERLKQRFPRLPICLLLDGLFAGGPTFAICDKYLWKYIIVLQEADLSSVHKEFNLLSPVMIENHLCLQVGGPTDLRQNFRWLNAIDYADSNHAKHTLNVIECLETQRQPGEQPCTTRFKWITNFKVTAKNVIELSNDGGRLRWKTENEGFNVQKNGGYALEHVYSHNATAGKVFYLLLQIAHLIFQLIEMGSLFRKAFPAGVGSSKNLALRLLEAWRNLRLTPADLQRMLNLRLQIRFNTS